MRCLLVAIHGILTRQTDPSWPDHLDAWMFRRDPRVKVLKKEYWAGPFPRWNCWVKDPRLAAALANEIELFPGVSGSNSAFGPRVPDFTTFPPIWFIAHSNGAVIALLTMQRLIDRGFWIGGLIFTGAACEADLRKNGVLEWCRAGRLGTAIACSSEDDAVVAGDARAPSAWYWKLRDWLWGKLIWPYGSLGRTGWMLDGVRFPGRETDRVFTRWFRGGHGTYFAPGNREGTFETIYRDLQCRRRREESLNCRTPAEQDQVQDQEQEAQQFGFLLLILLLILISGTRAESGGPSRLLSPTMENISLTKL